MKNLQDTLSLVKERLLAIKRLKSLKARLAEIQKLKLAADSSVDLLLLYLTDDSSRDVRQQALEVLTERGGPLCRIAARAALSDPWVLVRNTAAEALGEVGNKQDVPRLILALSDKDWIVCASAASSLGSLGGSRARKALLDALERTSHPDIKRYVAVALADLGDPSVIPNLTKILETETRKQVQSGLFYALYLLVLQLDFKCLLWFRKVERICPSCL